MRGMIALGFAWIGSFAAAEETRYAVQMQEVRTVTATLTDQIRAPKLHATRWVGFVVQPPDLPGQIVREARFMPDGQLTTEGSKAHRPILAADVRVKDDAMRIAIRFEAEFTATLQARKLVRLGEGQQSPVVEPLTPETRNRSLAATETCDFTATGVQSWLKQNDLSRRSGEGDVDLGRRVFQVLQRKFAYEYAGTLNRKASNVSRVGRSDCGGLGVLFVAAMRANGIPARQRIGRWAISDQKGQEVSGIAYHQWHAKAEFFAEGVGWVPVDPASGVLHDKTPEGSTYFGNDAGDFLTFHTDGDLEIDSRIHGRHSFDNMQGIIFWVNGAGTLDGMTDEEHWTVRPVTRRSP